MWSLIGLSPSLLIEASQFVLLYAIKGLANPGHNGGGAYVKLLGQSLAILSSILRQQFDQPFIEQLSHGDPLMQKRAYAVSCMLTYHLVLQSIRAS